MMIKAAEYHEPTTTGFCAKGSNGIKNSRPFFSLKSETYAIIYSYITLILDTVKAPKLEQNFQFFENIFIFCNINLILTWIVG